MHTPRPEAAIAILIVLLAAHRRSGGSPSVAGAVARQLHLLANHPLVGAPLRETCGALEPEWQALAGTPSNEVLH